ncbi:hypothetical protein PENTCL1PPCAC_30436, partial [Pristionchus entomophagus]
DAVHDLHEVHAFEHHLGGSLNMHIATELEAELLILPVHRFSNQPPIVHCYTSGNSTSLVILMPDPRSSCVRGDLQRHP